MQQVAGQSEESRGGILGPVDVLAETLTLIERGALGEIDRIVAAAP
ncbi:MAG: hypothetical protein AABZ30_10995 [Myxococcota bacterium]